MSISKETLSKYRKFGSVFIETGSYKGDTIQLALELDFKQIHSIELAEGLFNQCKERFKENDKVVLYKGDSLQILPKILENLNEPAVFWLDAHYSFGETTMAELYCPLYQELDIIKKHKIKNHCILIDDVRLFDTEFNVKMDLVRSFLLDINRKYTIHLDDGAFEKDILVAKI